MTNWIEASRKTYVDKKKRQHGIAPETPDINTKVPEEKPNAGTGAAPWKKVRGNIIELSDEEKALDEAMGETGLASTRRITSWGSKPKGKK